MKHTNRDIRQAITTLCDALCSYERITGIESILIVRQDDDFVFRADCGKPGISNDITDEMLLQRFKSQGSRLNLEKFMQDDD